MVEKFKEILKKIAEKGSVSLFSILKLTESAPDWIVVASLNTIKDDKDASMFFDYLYNLLKEYLTTDELVTISRINLYKTDSEVVQLFNKNLPTKEDEIINLHNYTINGFTVEEGYVFLSKSITSIV